MEFLEKDLEQIIYEATDLQLKQLDLKGKRFRQKRIGNYGISDLIFVSKIYECEYNISDDFEFDVKFVNECGLKITVCELKKEKIGISAFLQALNYCKGIKTYLNSRDFYNINFEILLIGKTIDVSGSFPYLTDLFYQEYNLMNGSINKISFFTYYYDFDGIKFKKEENYDLINKGF